MSTEILNKARENKADEFYTQMADIEEELRHYKDQFFHKSILCNCDDPYESNFFKYFALNFNFLGLKKLIAVSYSGSPVAYEQLSLFDIDGTQIRDGESKPAYKIEISEVKDENLDGAVDLTDVEFLIKNRKNTLTFLDGNGDFRSDECIELLKNSDIVVTNPPFSLFREYVTQIMEHKKDFLIIGNKNSINYLEVFSYIAQNKIRTGYRNINSDMWFIVPDDYDYEKIENGIRVKHIMACWFTNLKVKKHDELLTLYKQYSPAEYPHYVNYDAIEVSKVSDIPYDYFEKMGVPITFLGKYNPAQFEIIGSSGQLGKPMSDYAAEGTYTKGGPAFYVQKKNGTYKRLYGRIVIKRKDKKNEN
jgi:hypothetical protein